MQSQNIDLIRTLFQSRLATLEHLLKSAQTHFCDDESFLQKRIASDMFPFGTQIAFTCNQPRNTESFRIINSYVLESPAIQ